MYSEHTTGEGVDDHDLTVADDVVLVADEQLLRLERVVQVADQRWGIARQIYFNENANTIFQMESDGTVDPNLVPKLELYNDNKVSINYANEFGTYLGELPVILEFDVDDIENVEVSYVDPEDFS